MQTADSPHRPFELNNNYWDQRYQLDNTPWDLGSYSPSLIYLAERYAQVDSAILLPGAGLGHDLMELYRRGFHRTVALDWSAEVVDRLRQTDPKLPVESVIHADFFQHAGCYDLILEQTFFCALHPSQRFDYINHMSTLIKPGGILAGVWFVFPLTDQGPPFGGQAAEYRQLLACKFDLLRFERCRFSVPERWGKEWLIVARR